MSKAKMAAAQAYIEAKEYDHAREILYMINHPTADYLLEQLERIAPSGSNLSYLSATRVKADDKSLPQFPRLGQIVFLMALGAVLRLVYLANDDVILITQPIAAFVWYRLYVFTAKSRGYRPL